MGKKKKEMIKNVYRTNENNPRKFLGNMGSNNINRI